jgi:hypothetical protein
MNRMNESVQLFRDLNCFSVHSVGVVPRLKYTDTLYTSESAPTMKKADLEKMKGSKITSKLNQGPPGERFGKGAGEVLSRRDQRKLEQAQGLVPFAVKLDGALVQRIQTLAQEKKSGLNEVVTELLTKALDAKR